MPSGSIGKKNGTQNLQKIYKIESQRSIDPSSKRLPLAKGPNSQASRILYTPMVFRLLNMLRNAPKNHRYLVEALLVIDIPFLFCFDTLADIEWLFKT